MRAERRTWMLGSASFWPAGTVAGGPARSRGYRKIGLGVDISNVAARRLYFSEGYAESGLGQFLVSYPYIDEDGAERQAHETCTYLVKRLR